MRKPLFSFVLVLAVAISSIVNAAQTKDKSEGNFVGSWSGTWTGGSTGKFEMTISKDNAGSKDDAGKLAVTITPTPDQGESYTVNSTSVVASGDKLTVTFEAPSGEAEIKLELTVDKTSLKGNYLVRSKAQSEEIDKGTLSASKK